MPRVDSSQQFALIEAERDRVVRLARSPLPRRFLPGEHDGQSIEVGDQSAIDRFTEREQTRLVRQELADGDRVLPVLPELGPVRGDSLFVIQPAAGMCESERHCGETLGGGVDEHHRVLLPRLTSLLVANAAAEIDHLLPRT